MKARCEIPMKLPSLNDYIRVCRADRYQGAKMKREYEQEISFFVYRLPRFVMPVRVRFTWTEKDARRDLDNVAFAKKFILDTLVAMGKLQGDGQKFVIGLSDEFQRGREYGVMVEIEEAM